MGKLKYDKARTSQQLQQEYAQVSTALGQAYFAEREAIREQERLADRQDELAEAFKVAVGREQEAAAAKDRANKQDEAFKAKTADNGSEASEAATEPPQDTL